MKSQGEEWRSTFKSLNRVAFKALFSIWQPSQDRHGMEYWFWSGNGLPELFPWHPRCVRPWTAWWGFEGNLESRCLWALLAACGFLDTIPDLLSPSSLDTSNSRGLLGSLGMSLFFIVSDHANQILLRKPWVCIFPAGPIYTGPSLLSDCEGATCRFCSLSVAFAFFQILWSH